MARDPDKRGPDKRGLTVHHVVDLPSCVGPTSHDHGKTPPGEGQRRLSAVSSALRVSTKFKKKISKFNSNSKFVNNRRGDNNFIIAIKRTNSAVIATLQQSHEGLPKSIFLSQSSVESRD